MIEGRALIESVERVRASVEKIGGKFKSEYGFKDIIFVPKKKDCDLNLDLVRVRVYRKNNWPTKNVVLVRKKTEWQGEGKSDVILLKKEFDTEQETFAFIKKRIPEFEKSFEYSREGWEYELDSCRIFVENIERCRPSVEVEAPNGKRLMLLFQKIGVKEKEIMKKSVPEIMYRILQKQRP